MANDKKRCLRCEKERLLKHYYTSYSSLHGDKKVPICKMCLQEMIDVNDVETVKATLRQIDRPFIYHLWQSAVDDDRETFGMYMKNIAMIQYRELTWDDSVFGYESPNSTKKESKNTRKSETVNSELSNLTEKDIEELENVWGFGFEPQELLYFERKYKSLVGNYPVNTSLHEEALRTYCVYKVRAEVETAKGNLKDAKEWATLAQKQGEIAKINLNKLTKSDLSQGLDGFSQLARMVEQAVDIVPILPQFIEKPKDKIDFAIWCFINYERRLHGLPDIEHSDVYGFYEQKLKEHIESNPDIAKLATEVEIDYDGKGSKKKLLTIDYKRIVAEKVKEDPNDPFIKHLLKWVEFLSWARFYPDLFFDMISPEKGGIRLDADQRILLRCLARFSSNIGVFSRGYGKTMIELMGNYHSCIFYPDIEVAMTAQTKENASNLIGEKYREISRFFPLIGDELQGEPRISKDKAIVAFKSGAILDTLANQQSSKGARRKKMTVEESAQVSSEVFQDVLEPVVNIPRKTIGKMAVVNPYELNGQINSFTTSWYRGTDEYEKSLRMVQEMINLKGTMVLGAGWELPCELGRGELKSQILDKKEKLSPTFFALNYESKWVGVVGNALVSIKKVMDLRTLTIAELKGVRGGEYIIGVDVARSGSASNNQCSVAVLKLKRNSAGRIKAIQLVNMINIPSMLNFKVQAQEVMRIRNAYSAKAVVVDGNGLGE